MAVRGNPRTPVPKVARGNGPGLKNSFGTGKQYPDGSKSSTKRDDARPVPGIPKQTTGKSHTPGGGRVSPKPSGRVPVKRGSTRHRNG